MDLISDYLTYCSCYAILRPYAIWSAVGLLGATIHRKVYFRIGRIERHGNLYILFVGPAGNGKSTPNDFARELFETVCPALRIGASTQSVENICQEMSKADFSRVFTNERNEQIEVRPYAFFINEFKDFIAYNPARMLNFLGNIYDRKYFDASTIKRGLEKIVNPSINIVGCENPEPLVRLMKHEIVTGGMSRRIIIVYETGYPDPVPSPFETPEALAAYERVKQRLTDLQSIAGECKWTEESRVYHDAWYMDNAKRLALETNPVLKGYLSTKGEQMLKVAMLLDVCSDKPMLQFSVENIQTARAFLDILEPNMPKLQAMSGRNQMMPGQQKILEALDRAGGMMPEKVLIKMIESDLEPTERYHILRHLEESEQLLKKNMKVPNTQGVSIERTMLILPWKWDELQTTGSIKITPRPSGPPAGWGESPKT